MTNDAKVSVGAKIAAAREKRGMTQEELAAKAGCGEEYLGWIEDGQVEPPVALILRLSSALRIESRSLLGPTDDPETRRDEAAKRTEHYSYTNLTPSDENNHLMGFSISIPAQTAHEGVGYMHEGEEFVYVLSGSVDLTVGEDTRRLGPGESQHFNSNLDHHMSNPGDAPADLLVILYVP